MGWGGGLDILYIQLLDSPQTNLVHCELLLSALSLIDKGGSWYKLQLKLVISSKILNCHYIMASFLHNTQIHPIA